MYKSLSSPQKWIVKGIPILFFIGFLMHYIYGFSQNNIIIGLIAPVNETMGTFKITSFSFDFLVDYLLSLK